MTNPTRRQHPRLAALHPDETPRRQPNPRAFLLIRDADPSGVSGTGTIAEGVLFTSGKVAFNWLSELSSTTVFDHIEDVLTAHGHDGATHIEWLDR